MPHARTTLRAAVATLLTGLATTGARVHESRVRPRGDADLPCLLIETGREDIETDSMAGDQARVCEVTVTGICKGTGAIDDTLDQIALEVETLMTPTQTLGGVAKGLALARIDTGFNDELDKPIGFIALTYRAAYYTAPGAPSTPL